MKKNSNWKKLLIRGGLLLSPFALVFSCSVFLLYKSGEIFSVDRAIAVQASGQKAIFSLAYSYPVKYYKNERNKQRPADLMILGSSRVMQIRSEFFREPDKVYNAGGVINRIRFLRLFRKEWKHKPNTILLGLDFWWFNANYDDLKNKQFDSDLHHPSSNRSIILSEWQTILKDVSSGKAPLKKLLEKREIPEYGLLAIMKKEGFRNDGSYQYGGFEEKASLAELFKDDLGNFKRREDRLKKFDVVNKEALDELRKFLHQCKKDNIRLISFITPNSRWINDSIRVHPEDYAAFIPVQDSLSQLFKSEQLPLYNFTHLDSISAKEDEMVDAMHGSERVYAKLLLKILSQETALNSLCDSLFLQEKLRTETGRVSLFPNY